VTAEPRHALLERTPEEAARVLALALVEAAGAAYARLAERSDAEALHDFRVAVRRLRSTLRSYRPWLAGSRSRKLERQLERLGRATGGGRDAEVQLAWVRTAAAELRPHQRTGAAWLAARLEERCSAGYAQAAGPLAGTFPELAAGLRRRLAVYRTRVRLDAGAPASRFAAAAAAALRETGGDLQGALAEIGSAADQQAVHTARIRGKRLRYLLEPVAEEVAAARTLVRRLKGLQDLLGELHDAHVLEAELARAAGAAAAERAAALLRAALDGDEEAQRRQAHGRTAQPGILALALANRERRDTLFAALTKDWLDGRAAAFFDRLEKLNAGLEGKEPSKGKGHPERSEGSGGREGADPLPHPDPSLRSG
jgi:CHAD domain-containing protein